MGRETPVFARKDILFLGGLSTLLILGAIFRLHALGLPAYDCDELYAVRIQGSSLKEVASLIGRSAFHDLHPPLSYLLFMPWVSLFGTSEAAVRSLSMLLGSISIALLAFLGRRIGGVWTGLAAAAFLAFNPLHIAYSQEARPYALAVTLTIAAHLFFVRSLGAAPAWNRIVYGLLLAAAVYTHYFALIALLPHGFIALWLLLTGDEDSRRAARQTLLAHACGMAAFIGWLPALFFQLFSGQAPSFHYLDLGASPLSRTASYLRNAEGLGTSPLLLLTATLALLLLTAFAFAGRERLPATPGSAGAEGSPPRWVGALLLAGGLLLAVALPLMAPSRLFPPARQVLLAKGYTPEAIERELHGLRQLMGSFPLAAGIVGLLMLVWPWLSSRLGRLRSRIASGQGRPLAVNVLLGILLLVPMTGVLVLGLRDLPLLSARNLLILEPPLTLALGLGAARLAKVRWGPAALVPIVLCLALVRWQYQPVSGIFGHRGIPLGMQTGAWRDLAHKLERHGKGDLALVVAETPESDPALFYLKDHSVRRIAEPGPIAYATLPGEFRFIHLKGDQVSEALLADLSSRTSLRPELQVDEFVVYDARRASATLAKNLSVARQGTRTP
jgi:4-amino-4-deoxy-L-arabinose transferase-like glycosyltransferase